MKRGVRWRLHQSVRQHSRLGGHLVCKDSSPTWDHRYHAKTNVCVERQQKPNFVCRGSGPTGEQVSRRPGRLGAKSTTESPRGRVRSPSGWTPGRLLPLWTLPCGMGLSSPLRDVTTEDADPQWKCPSAKPGSIFPGTGWVSIRPLSSHRGWLTSCQYARKGW